ncbi:MAG: antitoxin VapB family protein [Thermoanaerobaculia bacterium]
MAIRTVKLDDEAYEILTRAKRPGQTFSDAVKERLGSGRRSTARDLLAAARDANLSEDTLDRIEEVVQARRQSPAPVHDL